MIIPPFIGASISSGTLAFLQGLQVLAKFGANAHLWLPGVGVINGLTAANFQDSAGTTAAAVDLLVGLIKDGYGGQDASQSTSGQRPVLRRGLVNLFGYSQDFTNAYWAKGTVSVTLNNGVAPDGSTTTSLVVPGTANVTHQIDSTNYVASGGSVTVAAIVKPGAYSKYGFRENVSTGNWVTFDLSGNGSVIGSSVATGTILLIGNGNYLITFKMLVTSGATYGFSQFVLDNGYVSGSPSAYTFSGNGSTGLWLYRSGLFLGNVAPAEIPLTTTAPASSSTGNYGLQYVRGSSNNLNIAAPVFQMSDDFAVVCGATSEGNLATYRELFAQAAGGASEALPEFGFTNANKFQIFVSGGGVDKNIISGVTEVAGVPSVATCYSRSATIGLRRNAASQGTLALSGVYTTATNAKIGAIGRSAVANYMDGTMGPLAVIKGTVGDTDLLTLERMVGSLTGPTGVSF